VPKLIGKRRADGAWSVRSQAVRVTTVAMRSDGSGGLAVSWRRGTHPG
jgi:hypothetical protein